MLSIASFGSYLSAQRAEMQESHSHPMPSSACACIFRVSSFIPPYLPQLQWGFPPAPRQHDLVLHNMTAGILKRIISRILGTAIRTSTLPHPCAACFFTVTADSDRFHAVNCKSPPGHPSTRLTLSVSRYGRYRSSLPNEMPFTIALPVLPSAQRGVGPAQTPRPF